MTPAATVNTSNNSAISLNNELIGTLGRIESAMAIVITDDMQIMEIPSTLIPSANREVGSTIRLQVCTADDLHSERLAQFMGLQDRMEAEFGEVPQIGPIEDCLHIEYVSHTSISLGWPSWGQLCGASYAAAVGAIKVHTIEGYCNGKRVTKSQLLPDATELRLSSLEPDSAYQVKIIFRTSAGRFASKEIQIHTPPLEDLSCLRVMLDRGVPEEVEGQLGGLNVECSREFEARRTTHVVTMRSRGELMSGWDDGELFTLCEALHIPIVTTSWVNSCLQGGKMQSVSQFYSK